MCYNLQNCTSKTSILLYFNLKNRTRDDHRHPWHVPNPLSLKLLAVFLSSERKWCARPSLDFFFLGLIRNPDTTNSKVAFKCCFSRFKIYNKGLPFCHSVMKQNKNNLKKETDLLPKWQPKQKPRVYGSGTTR